MSANVHVREVCRVLARFSAKRGGKVGLPKRGVVFCKECVFMWLWFVESGVFPGFLEGKADITTPTLNLGPAHSNFYGQPTKL